jgi:hypothetical protein
MKKARRTDDEWRVLLSEQRASGQTQEEWCATKGINLNTMKDRGYRLNRIDKELKIKPQHKKPKATATGWLEVKAECSSTHTADICIAYGGFTVTVTAGYDTASLTEALRAVSLACC